MPRLSGGSLLLINFVIYCKLSVVCKQAALPVVFVCFRYADSGRLRIKRALLESLPPGVPPTEMSPVVADGESCPALPTLCKRGQE